MRQDRSFPAAGTPSQKYPWGYTFTMAHDHGIDVLNDLAPLTRDLRNAIPDVYEGFRQMHHASVSEGALDTQTKELIAFAIAVSKQCDGCIASHARAAAKAGATKQQAAEALGVTILMNGGPATIYAPRAYAAFCDFADAAAAA